MLAYAMSGEPLPLEHGYPLRLIVPGWHAVASVKWLTEVEVIGSPFQGFFQAERYVYETGRDGTTVREPVRLQKVRSVIIEPAADHDITLGDLVIRAVAWSGAAAIEKSLDDLALWLGKATSIPPVPGHQELPASPPRGEHEMPTASPAE